MDQSTRAGTFAALRSRDFRLFWGGQTVSLAGDGAFMVAMGWRVVDLTGHASSLAILLLLQSTAMLATLLIGGALADRYSRKALMILSDLARAAVVAVLAAADATGHLSFGLWVALAILFGLGDGFFIPAFGGMLPLVVEQPYLASANALIGVSRNMSFVIGPALAGFLYHGVGSPVVFALEAGTFVFSAGLLALARPRVFEREPSEGTWREIVAGARYVTGVPWLWITVSLSSLAIMVAWAPFQSLLPKLVQLHFHRGPASYGSLFSAQAVGMVAGALLFGRLQPRGNRVLIAYTAWAVNDLCAIAVALVGSYDLAVALIAARGIFVGFANALWETVLVELVPERMLSRVSSLDFFGALGLTPVGYALAAGVAGFFSPSVIISAGFAFAFVLWAVPLSVRRVRSAG